MMEDEIACQTKEEQAVAGQVQALWEKFAAAANKKYLSTKEKEVRWSVDKPERASKKLDAIMKEATPSSGPPVSWHVSCAGKQGSMHQSSTGLAKVTKMTA
jgi:hypothetical protein